VDAEGGALVLNHRLDCPHPFAGGYPQEAELMGSGAADRLVAQLLANPDWRERIVHVERIPERPAKFESVEIHPALAPVLRSRGIDRLYSHQAAAFRSIQAGENTAVSTPTASGKSLIYLLPLWESRLQGEDVRALYLSPLKALAQDQLRIINELNGSVSKSARLTAELYDGDTPTSKRAKVRGAPPSLVLSNPDMVHLSILPAHHSWAKFLSTLKYVVLDEAHTYRGVFGMHVSGILRRLRRVCARYGSNPKFIVTSATLSNPDEFLGRLTGESFRVISESGAPTAGRRFMLVKPSANVYTESCELLNEFLDADLKTIVFTKARRITELLARWLGERAPEMAKKVKAYRAGFLPEERRTLERALAGNELRGIISTSALELGIDIGGLDGCILVGFPGTILSTWQRAGRAGRGGEPALIALVGMEDALDHFFLTHPREFFSRPAERLLLDEANPTVLKSHLACAAAEFPLAPEDEKTFGPSMHALVGELVAEGKLMEAAAETRWHSSLKAPQRYVNIRSAGESFTIENPAGKLLGSIDGFRVFNECHPQAIYLHGGTTYEVVGLNLDSHKVTAREVEVDWYTQPVSTKETTVLKQRGEKPFGPGMIAWGDVRVTSRVVQYERHQVRGGGMISVHDLQLPKQEFETQAVWLVVPWEAQRPVLAPGRHLLGSLHALEHAAIALFPLFALCDRWDLGGISTAHHPHTGTASVFIYDGVPGGIGLARYAYDIYPELLRSVVELVEACPCEDGCPSCIHSPKCGNHNKPLDKAGVLALARSFLSGTAEGKHERAQGVQAGTTPAPAAAGLFPVEAVARQKEAPADSTPVPSPARHNHTLVFDLETQKLAAEVGGWDNKRDMKMSVGVVYDCDDGVFRDYMEDGVQALYADLAQAKMVIGFNIINFDLEVLSAYVSPEKLKALPVLDLLERVHFALKRRVKLDDLASATLGRNKTAEGTEAVRWFRERDFTRLIEYCRADVALTRDLWDFGLKNRFVLFPSAGGIMKVRVEW
jgi:DEAD/DEAH box helicase domain-containing protein